MANAPEFPVKRASSLSLSCQPPSVHLLPMLHTLPSEWETLGKMKSAVYGHLNVHILLSLVYKHVDKKAYRKQALNRFDYDVVHHLFTLKILIA